MPDQVRIVEIPSDAWPVLSEKAGEDDVGVLVRAVIEEQSRVLQIASAPKIWPAAWARSRGLRRTRCGRRAHDLAERIERAEAAAIAPGEPAPWWLRFRYETLAALMPHSAAAEEPGDTKASPQAPTRRSAS